MLQIVAAKNSSHMLYASKKDNGILYEQWVSFLVEWHLICCTERVPNIWDFVSNLIVNCLGKWHGETHNRWIDVDQSSSHAPHTSLGNSETLHKQWISFLVI